MLVSFASSWLPSSKLLVNAGVLSARACERQGWGLGAFVQNLEDRRRGTTLAQLLDRVWQRWWESHLPFWVNSKHGRTHWAIPGGRNGRATQAESGMPLNDPPKRAEKIDWDGQNPWFCNTLQDLPSFWELLRFHVFCLCFLVRFSLSTC